MFYSIHWVSSFTGFRGRGKYIENSKEKVDDVIVKLNEKYPEFHHWTQCIEQLDELSLCKVCNFERDICVCSRCN